MWWLTTVGKPVWVPSVRDFKFFPPYKGQAHRLFMSGYTKYLLKEALT